MIKIYMLVDHRSGQPFYVGASKANEKAIIYRHIPKRFVEGEPNKYYGFSVEILDNANTVTEAANLEEYWYFQLRSWGFTLENYFIKSYKRYSPSCIYLNA
jgi:hypothetical protein